MLSEQQFKLTSDNPTKLTPHAVLVLHSRQNQKRHNGNLDLHVDAVTYHDIHDGKIEQGSAIDKARLIEVMHEEKQTEFTWIEPTTLVDNASSAVWYRPSSRRTLHLKANEEPIQFKVKFPATLFIYQKKSRSLSMFALASDERPTLDSKLYVLPVGNIKTTGKLCLGSGASYLPKKVEQKNFHEVERCFFDALSTHTSTRALFKRDVKENRNTSMQKLVNYWQRHASNGTQPNVSKDFIKLSESLNSFIKIGR